ncbi:MAG TPA: chromate efflux transporter [bacterium]|nr:chromate efflux transporter [bacterium]
MSGHAAQGGARRVSPAREVFVSFLRLGVTSFGGPIAHLGYYNDEFVRRRRWLDESTFAQVVALCQFLPGPASSQVAIIIGLTRGGVLGAVLAWIAFTLPSAVALVAFALGIARIPGVTAAPWIHGLLIAAVAVVALAVSNMYRSLCPDVPRKIVAFAAAALILLSPANGLVQLAVIVFGALYGRFFLTPSHKTTQPLPVSGNRVAAVAAGAVFVGLLVGFPIAQRVVAPGWFSVFGAFYESGALVFGGGHVVLPLLQARVVPPGWVSPSTFLAGYGAAQAVPGPLFTFAAYLGAAMHGPVGGVGGAALALFAIYLPSFLLIAAILPFWNSLMRNRSVVAAVQGVNAAVVGVLLAALYQPVWVTAVHTPADVTLALLAFLLLDVLKTAPWLVVVASAAAAELLHVL